MNSIDPNCAVGGPCFLLQTERLVLADTVHLDSTFSRRRVARQDFLYKSGEPFRSLYEIRFGHFETRQHAGAGVMRITGFRMAGEMLGLDAISDGTHRTDAIALDDCEVFEILLEELENFNVPLPSLLRRFHRLVSDEIARSQNMMLLLGRMRAEQRMAVFLIDLSVRYAARGYAGSHFQLRMPRKDIGNYLGLTIESVSRLLSCFQRQGLVKVDKREVTLIDRVGLNKIALGAAQCPLMWHRRLA